MFKMRIAQIFAITCLISSSTTEIIEVVDYWPEVASDLSLVTWSHGTNSQEELQAALTNDTIMMLEADVNLGFVDGDYSQLIPVMAHPPDFISDLSLADFVQQFVDATEQGKRKGMKLDFKTITVVEDAMKTVQAVEDQINFPLWFNADILPGPGSTDALVKTAMEVLGIEGDDSAIPWTSIMPRLIDPDEFLRLATSYFPSATLSTGWTTGATLAPGEAYAYTQEQVDEMLATLQRNNVGSQPVTFPVRAIFVGESQEVLQNLLVGSDSQGRISTLTMWGTDDIEDVDQLRDVVNALGRDRMYIDTTPELLDEINNGRAGDKNDGDWLRQISFGLFRADMFC